MPARHNGAGSSGWEVRVRETVRETRRLYRGSPRVSSYKDF